MTIDKTETVYRLWKSAREIPHGSGMDAIIVAARERSPVRALCEATIARVRADPSLTDVVTGQQRQR